MLCIDLTIFPMCNEIFDYYFIMCWIENILSGRNQCLHVLHFEMVFLRFDILTNFLTLHSVINNSSIIYTSVEQNVGIQWVCTHVHTRYKARRLFWGYKRNFLYLFHGRFFSVPLNVTHQKNSKAFFILSVICYNNHKIENLDH